MSWLPSALAGAVAGMSPGIVAFCLGVMFVAAFIRGFTGFGSSLLWVPGLSLVLPPVAVVPVTLLLEFIVSVHLLPSVRHDAHWPSLRWIWLGAVLGVPVGLAAIVRLPADMTRGAVAVTVIAAAILLWRGGRLAGTLSRPATVGVGVVAGLLTGGVGIPGPPVFLYYLSAPLEHRVGRASIIGYLMGLAPVACLFAAWNGMLDRDAIVRVLLLTPVVLAGTWLGAHAFGKADPEKARQWTLLVLLAIGLALLLRVLVAAA
jgi:uncharacterized protein